MATSALPQGAVLSPSRHPFQLFILLLCLVNGLPVLLGESRPPGSLESALPVPFVYGWALFLTVGSAVALVGTAWRNRFVGVLIEQVGLVGVGLAAVLYGGVLEVVASQQGGGVSASIVLGFGLACLWRWWQLQKYVKAVVALVETVNEEG